MAPIETTLPSIPHYVPPPATKEKLEFAQLPIIDFSKLETPQGQAELAVQVQETMQDIGFFYIVNHGYSQSQNDRIFDIADVAFSQVSEGEKHKYADNFPETGRYHGYKLPRSWHINNGVKDEIEQYGLNRDVTKREHPEALRPLLLEIQEFSKFNHYNVLHPVLRLLAIGLELPEDTLVNLHRFDAPGDSAPRFMKYSPRREDEEEKAKQVWLKGHTDIGSVSILWSQPVSGLQILSPDGKWRWLKHIDNALVVNVGEAMEFLSGGYYRATIHRVVQPPIDQRGYARLGVFYFGETDDNVKLAPLTESPVLMRKGIKRRFKDEDAPTMEMWSKAVTKAYGTTELTKLDDGHEGELINGYILVKHYN